MKQAAITQFRVVAALILREMRVRYGASQIGYVWALVEPITYISAISLIFYTIGNRPAFGSNFPIFFATGMLPFILYRNLTNQLTGAFDANEALLTYPIVKELDTVYARAFLEFATISVVMLIIIITIISLTGAPLPNDFFQIGKAIIGLFLLGFGIGLCNAVISIRLKTWRNMYNMLATPLFFLSCIFYSLESLPPKIRDILVWNPIVHGVEGFRAGYFLNYRATGLDVTYLYYFAIVLILIGFSAERANRLRS